MIILYILCAGKRRIQIISRSWWLRVVIVLIVIDAISSVSTPSRQIIFNKKGGRSSSKINKRFLGFGMGGGARPELTT